MSSDLFLLKCIDLFPIRKSITINIVDREEYEKNKNFFIELGEPRVSNQEKDFYDIVSKRTDVFHRYLCAFKIAETVNYINGVDSVLIANHFVD